MGAANLDLELIRTFHAVVNLGGFTKAAEYLHKTQSTVSAQIKKLEEFVGQPILDRTTRSMHPTAAGELILDHGRELLRMNDDLISRLLAPEIEGTVRLGTPEDFATQHLPSVLAEFAEAHPRVRLEVTCDLTRKLLRQFEAGRHDLILVKREPMGPSLGTKVWREPLVWVRGTKPLFDTTEISLVVSPEPCVYRERAIAALSSGGYTWRITYQSTSLAGSLAAVSAGLGITILPRDMVPHGFHIVGEHEDMPELPDTEIALIARLKRPTIPVVRLREHITRALEST